MSEALTLSAEGLEKEGRFSRFELISWWDQERLSRARVLVIGAGALGNEIVKNCALLGVGSILIADMDTIENSNLSRSVLFREKNNGEYKAEAACRAARDIYPEIKARAMAGNVVYDLGLGAYLWADVILGGLDNREARVAVNRGAAFAGRAWIDGAIEVLSGLVRVFDPARGPCYECTMSETDWKILESRRSCALLSREEMELGRVPTTPTTGSIIAGLQVQEAVKLLHGIEAMSGRGLSYDGLTGQWHSITYPRKPDCYGHEQAGEVVKTGRGAAGLTVGELLSEARQALGREAVVELSRDVISGLICTVCGTREEKFASLGRVTEAEAVCPGCGQIRAPETLLTLGLEEGLEDRTLADMGVPYYDVVTARNEEKSLSFMLDGDEDLILGDLER